VLEAGESGRAIVAAIHALNQGVEVRDRGSYLRVSVPERCRVTKRAIEHALGRPFRLPGDLELVMPSFTGHLRLGEEEVTWEAKRT
jgi:toluene monooxygenase system protein D